MKALFIDTSAFVMLQDEGSARYGDAKRFWEQVLAEPVALYTSNFVFDESYTLLLYRIGKAAAMDFGDAVLSSRRIQIVRVDEEHEVRAWEIAAGYQDKSFSYTDSTSFAIMENLGLRDAFAFDRHFEQFGFVRHPA